MLEGRAPCLTDLGLADHVCGLDPSKCGGSRMERLEAEPWPRDPLDEAMILLDDIVEISGLNNGDNPSRASEFEDDVQTLQAC